VRKFYEKAVESIFTISGFITSIVIVLVVVFLFSGGINLFRSRAIEAGYVVAVHYSNPVETLTPTELKDIFDQEKTNWEQFGGIDEEILVFRLNDITNYFTDEELGEEFEFVPARISQLIAENRGMIAFIPKEYVSAKTNN
jgi:phosphate transport system permease protein